MQGVMYYLSVFHDIDVIVNGKKSGLQIEKGCLNPADEDVRFSFYFQ